MNRLLVLLALSLGACQSGTVNTTQAIADANIVVSGISADYKAFVALYPNAVPAAQQAQVNAALAAAQAALTQLSSASTTATGLQAVETDINLVIGVLEKTCQPPPGTQSICPQSVSAGLLAANVLLPLIEVTINQLQGVPVTPKVAAAMAHPAMSPEQARLVLAAAR